MKKSLKIYLGFLLIFGPMIPVVAQKTTNYLNFTVEGNKLIWVKVFEAQGMTQDSIQRLILLQLKRKGINVKGEDNGVVFAEISKYNIREQDRIGVASLGLWEFNAKVEISIKPNKYRIEISDMYEDIISSKAELMPYKLIMNDSFVRKDGTLVSNSRALKTYETYEKKFIDFFKMALVEKKDW